MKKAKRSDGGGSRFGGARKLRLSPLSLASGIAAEGEPEEVSASPPVYLLLLMVGFFLACSTGAGAAEKSEKATDEKQKTEQEKPTEKGTSVFSSEKESVRITIPAGDWKTMTAEDMQRDAPGGCLPAAGPPEGLVLTIQKTDSQAMGTVSRLPQTFLLRNEEDLRSFIQEMKDAITGTGEGTEIRSSELTRREGLYVHTMEFVAQPRGLLGGCGATSPSDGQPPRMRYVVRDYFVRPQGEEALLYRVGTMAPAESYEDYAGELETFGTSFEFTGERAEEFFEPDAAEDKLPEVPQASEEECGAFDSPMLIVFAVIVVVLWWWTRRRMKGSSGQQEGGKAQGEGTAG